MMTENENAIAEVLKTMKTAMSGLEALLGPSRPRVSPAPRESKSNAMRPPGKSRPRKRSIPVSNEVGKRLHVYVAGCGGLARVARSSNDCVFKIGTTKCLETRLLEMGTDRYGAAVQSGDAVAIESGFSAWVAQMIHVTKTPIDVAITVQARSIAVDLPTSMTTRMFDTALSAALSPRALKAVPGSGFKPRLTAFSIGDRTRISTATEFYRFTPKQDGDVLLAAIESVLRRHRSKHV